jgi:hypothetical protein
VKTLKTIIIIPFLISAASYSFAQSEWEILEEKKRAWYKPDYTKLQYAGNIGFMSIGAGYTWWREVAQTDLIYGYVPESKGNATIHTFTLKNTFGLYKFNLFNTYNISPILGFSVSFEPGQNSFGRLPEKYPDGYYGRSCFYACLNLGLKTKFEFSEDRHFSSMEIYSELNTVADYEFYNVIAKEDRSNIIYSLALGVNMFF